MFISAKLMVKSNCDLLSTVGVYLNKNNKLQYYPVALESSLGSRYLEEQRFWHMLLDATQNCAVICVSDSSM